MNVEQLVMQSTPTKGKHILSGLSRSYCVTFTREYQLCAAM